MLLFLNSTHRRQWAEFKIGGDTDDHKRAKELRQKLNLSQAAFTEQQAKLDKLKAGANYAEDMSTGVS